MAISDSGSDQGTRLLQRAAAATLERIERDRKRADNVGVERILACLGRNLFRRGLNVKWLRAVLGLHDNGVSSEFRSEMGTNLRTYLEDRRLETACWLLVKTDLQVGEIGKRVGYRTLSTFSHAFERRLGCRPTVYRDTGGTAGRTDWQARETSAAPRRGPRLPRFLAGVLAVSEGQRCHRCRTPLNVGRGPRVLENLRPICDLCVRDHGPPALRSFLKRGIGEEDAKARDSPGAVVAEKAERGRRGQLSQHEADSLIWSLLSLYPQSLHVVTEYLADKTRKHEQSEGRPLLEAEALGDREPDFCLLISSLSSVLGGVGMVADVAADCCLELLARSASRDAATVWRSILWDDEGAGAMRPEDGVAALGRLLCSQFLPCIAVSTVDLEARIDLRYAEPEKAGEAVASRRPRPQLESPYAAPEDELEEAICAIWEELFGIGGIGIDDDFFALGGHSLLATQLVSRVRDQFEVELLLREALEMPTVRQLAVVVAEKQIAAGGGDLEQFLDQLEGMSDEEAREISG